MVNIVAEHFIKLCIVEKYRKLTLKEQFEKKESLKFLEARAWKKAQLENMSLMAHMTDDWEWQHEICANLEKL